MTDTRPVRPVAVPYCPCMFETELLWLYVSACARLPVAAALLVAAVVGAIRSGVGPSTVLEFVALLGAAVMSILAGVCGVVEGHCIADDVRRVTSLPTPRLLVYMALDLGVIAGVGYLFSGMHDLAETLAVIAI